MGHGRVPSCVLRKACFAHVRAVNLSVQAVHGGLACASKLRKLLAAERIELAEGGAFALIALERVVAFPAEGDT
jgi:hypothetical protein